MKNKIKFFSKLFSKAVKLGVSEAKALEERCRAAACETRVAIRERLKAEEDEDLEERRAPRPTFENVAGNPNELVIMLQSPALSPRGDARSKAPPQRGGLHRDAESKEKDQIVYALVDVSRLNQGGKKRGLQCHFNV